MGPVCVVSCCTVDMKLRTEGMASGLTLSKVSETEVSDHLAGDRVRFVTEPTCGARSTGRVQLVVDDGIAVVHQFLMGDDLSDGSDSSVPVVGREVPVPFPGSLTLPATGREVAQFVALRAAACVGADYANLALLNPETRSLRLFHDTFLDADIADRYTDVPLDAPYPIAAAARAGRVVLLPDLESYRDQFPEIVPDTVAAGVQATASLPLYRADRTLLGAIGFAWVEPTPFDRKLEAALRAVAQPLRRNRRACRAI